MGRGRQRQFFRSTTIFMVFCFFFTLFLTDVGAEDKKFKLTLSGASPGGLWSLLGEGTSAAIAKSFPGSSLSYQTSGGGLANIMLVSKGKVEMGLAHGVEIKTALDGKDPFKEPIKNLTALAYFYNWAPMQYVIRKDFAEKYGIKSVQDIADKKPPIRVAVNQKGNMVEYMNRMIFEESGFTYEDIDSWKGQVVYVHSKEMANLMRDRRIDMFGNGVFAPHSSILETANGINVTLLPLSQSVIDSVSVKTGTDPFVIKKSAYDFIDIDVPTVALGCMAIVQKEMSQEDVYLITKALVENIDAIRNVHKSMKNLTPELMASQSVIPYHPGAEKLYREKGLIK